MHLSQTAEYALRAAAYLAVNPGELPIRATALSEATSIPVHYLSKIMRRLVTAGLVSAQKGHGGGFALALQPNQIRYADVLRAVDYPLVPNRCAFGWGKCNDVDPCPLHATWSVISDQFQQWAWQTTLGDLSPKDSPRQFFKETI